VKWKERAPSISRTVATETASAERRAAIHAAVEAYNRAHPDAQLPRPAARLLLAMFPLNDEFTGSQETLRNAGFGKQLGGMLRALIGAGLVSRQLNKTSTPSTYRLLLP